ncbi:alpha/beta hydrolase [Pseudonocardia oroxyli]|nr:alpha/beta hydrolase [Pseudonocardia oroxyli]
MPPAHSPTDGAGTSPGNAADPADPAPDAAGAAAEPSAGVSAADAALALDALLLEAARGPRARLLPVGPAARLALGVLRNPAAAGTAAGRTVGLLAELGRIGIGADLAGAEDRGRVDGLLGRLRRAHRASRSAALDLVDDLARDRADADRLRFAVDRLAELTVPGAHPLLDPDTLRSEPRAAVRSTADAARLLLEEWGGALGAVLGAAPGTTRRAGPVAAPAAGPGTALGTGPGAALSGLGLTRRAAPRLPGGGARLEPGIETATAPGAVVLRTPVFELIHHLPTTEQVAEVPVLVVPPFANSYALVDLAPDRSLVRTLVAAGHQVLTLSWHPVQDPSHGLDAAAAALVEALGAVERICRSERTVLLGVAGGGLLAAVTTAVLARPERVAGLVLAGTALEGGRDRPGPGAGLPVDEASVRSAVAAVARAGALDGRTLAEVHALLDPAALIRPAWERRDRATERAGPEHTEAASAGTAGAASAGTAGAASASTARAASASTARAVSAGTAGAAPDPLRAWNLAARDVPAALYRDLVEAALSGALTRPGGLTVLGEPVDLAAVAPDAYVVTGATDLVGGWRSAYRTTQLLGAKSRFVLVPGSTAAAVGYGSAELRAADGPVSPGNPADPERWRAHAHREPRSWWDDLVDWLADRGGDTVDAPPELGGGRGLHPIHPAPGTYLAR